MSLWPRGRGPPFPLSTFGPRRPWESRHVTTAIATEVQRRERRREPATAFDRLADLCDELLARVGKELDRAKYAADPVGFARDVLGYTPCHSIQEVRRALAADPKAKILWWKQIEILEAVRDHARVCVRSGHKVSKSHTAAIIALWFYACFDEARVVLTAVTARQVDAILWREVRKHRARAVQQIDGAIGELARTGLKSDDFREIVGFTAREAEAVAGVSGKNLLYIPDEASGIADEIFEAMDGNRAGGARMVMFSNPTRTEGYFFEAFHEKVRFWKPLHISSEDSPNVLAGESLLPGLATRAWVDEMRSEWGADSPFFKVRVQGKFVENEQGKILSLHAITQAEERWPDTEAQGVLEIGIDPSGPGEGGDESAFAVRRGKKLLSLDAMRGLSAPAHLAHALGYISANRRPRDPVPLIKIDREGPIGGEILGIFRAHLEQYPNAFEVIGVRSSDRACRQPDKFDRVRDELWWNLYDWFREGGAILEDKLLEKELHAPSWLGQVTGRMKVTPKPELRKMLGRSPDRADALALAVWVPMAFEPSKGDGNGAGNQGSNDDDGGDLDPYAGGIDPYAWEGRR